MLSDAEIRGTKNLASAILRSALTDAEKGYCPSKLESFASSEWCEMLCNIVGISLTAYRRELGRLVEEYIFNCKLKRLKTYELVKVLKDGKDTRSDQIEGDGQVPLPASDND